ncbi:MAG: hypothetical protein Q4F25_05310 [Eubacteriales bacterium]|nr:hypothetical protein [Eubacteriales bacterium]
MNLMEIAQKLTAGEVAGWAVVLLIILFSLIQIAPVKLNPWDNILGWFGRKLNGATEKRLEKVEKQIRDMWINNHRQTILTFARECREEINHSPDEWTNVLNVAEEYERYVTENQVTNGIITQDTEYIRRLYQEMSREHRI